MHIARAYGMANPDRRGGANSQRDHIGEAGNIQGNLVSGKLHCSQFADEKRCCGKCADFQKQLQGRRQSQTNQLAYTP